MSFRYIYIFFFLYQSFGLSISELCTHTKFDVALAFPYSTIFLKNFLLFSKSVIDNLGTYRNILILYFMINMDTNK